MMWRSIDLPLPLSILLTETLTQFVLLLVRVLQRSHVHFLTRLQRPDVCFQITSFDFSPASTSCVTETTCSFIPSWTTGNSNRNRKVYFFYDWPRKRVQNKMVFFSLVSVNMILDTVYLIAQILVTINVYTLLDCFFLSLMLGLLSF